MNVLALNGCSPTPLAHYMKALGILRLVTEQVDPLARGWWDAEGFRLATRLTREELERWFLEDYAPTPMLDPWNKGSGFFFEVDAGLTPAERSTAPRLAPLRAGIADARRLTDAIGEADAAVRAIKAEPKALPVAQRDRYKGTQEYASRLAQAEKVFKAAKSELIPQCRRAWRGPHLEWMDAAMVLDTDGSPLYPAILGTGGNDGRLDFANNFLQRLNEVFDLEDPEGRSRAPAQKWVRVALWGATERGLVQDCPVGQYLPGGAGGANATAGPVGNGLVNPMDFVLMMEGSVIFRSQLSRRMEAQGGGRASAPFALGAQAAGYASAGAADEGARGEQWMPLWNRPATLREVRHLMAEGRAQLGARNVREPLDFARAIARLGTARGISEFQRFGFIERNGQSNLAVPLGRFRVPDRASPRLSCLEDLEAWLSRCRREARAKGATHRFIALERRLTDALFAVTQHPDEPARWQRVLLDMAELEAVMASGSGSGAGPIPRLRPEWFHAANDGSPLLRLALAFARQAGDFKGSRPQDPVRAHFVSLDKKGRFLKGDPDRRVVLTGRDGVGDAVALVQRRLVESSRTGRRLPLVAAPGASVGLSDLAAVVAGEVDLDRTLTLARAFTALTSTPALTAPPESALPDDAWLAIRLALLPHPLPDGRTLGADPAIVRRLAAGDGQGAVEIALRRLTAGGVRCGIRASVTSSATARLWAAALAFPVSARTSGSIARRLDPSLTQGV